MSHDYTIKSNVQSERGKDKERERETRECHDLREKGSGENEKGCRNVEGDDIRRQNRTKRVEKLDRELWIIRGRFVRNIYREKNRKRKKERACVCVCLDIIYISSSALGST